MVEYARDSALGEKEKNTWKGRPKKKRDHVAWSGGCYQRLMGRKVGTHRKRTLSVLRELGKSVNCEDVT